MRSGRPRAQRWRLPIKPKLVSTRKLPGRRVRVDGTKFFVFLPSSVMGTFSIGNINFTFGKFGAKPDRPIPESWLRRLT